MAAKAYLEKENIESLTLRQIASLSAVSPPTVYAHFATMDDLVAAFFLWLKPRLGLDRPLPPLAELPSMPERLFPLYDQYGALLRNLMNQPSWDRQRYADRDNRLSAWVAGIGGGIPNLTPTQLRRGALAIASFWSPTYWRWLMDTCRFTPEEAQAVASWGIQALIGALKADASGLDRLPAAPVASEAPQAKDGES
ncbi:MAG TPA: helix-turn-helix domain-containing protein [Methylocystis sp.]